MRKLFGSNVARILAIALILGTGWLAQLPTYSAAEQRQLAAAFSFSRAPLPSASHAPLEYIRSVQPQLHTIRSWISAVGAAVALTDGDGDGLPNDYCLVDPRTNSVTVGPVPGTGARYRPFLLTPSPLPYDSATTAPLGCLPSDLDDDGQTDFLVYYWGRTPIMFLRKPGSDFGPQGFVRRELVSPGARWYTDTIAQADVDGDGKLDLIVGNYFPDGSRVLDAAAKDDPLMQMQDSMSRADNGGTDRILLRTGPARFREATDVLRARVANGWTLAIATADLNGDLRPEIYFANDFGPDRLLLNESRPGRVRLVELRGDRSFTTPASKVLGTDSFKGMGADFADVNGDGRLDLFVSNITSEYALQESNFLWMATGSPRAGKPAPFTDRSDDLGLAHSGWSWDAKFGDFTNDGQLELVQANGFLKGTTDRWPELQELAMANDSLLHHSSAWPRFAPGDDLNGHQPFAFWVRGPSGRYVNLAPQIGLDDAWPSRGIATADVNGDGRLDFAVANQWGPSFFYLNRSPRGGRFLGLSLRLPAAGRAGTTRVLPYPARALPTTVPALGAQVEVQVPGGRRTVVQVDAGNGHASVRAPELLVGLGQTPARAVRVTVNWRDLDGNRHRTRLRLAPGWHTVLLGQR